MEQTQGADGGEHGESRIPEREQTGSRIVGSGAIVFIRGSSYPVRMTTCKQSEEEI
jgi:hypothetical protein